jgi:hypothetical protein
MEYTISDLILSTITVEAKISNINFKEKELIELLSLDEILKNIFLINI